MYRVLGHHLAPQPLKLKPLGAGVRQGWLRGELMCRAGLWLVVSMDEVRVDLRARTGSRQGPAPYYGVGTAGLCLRVALRVGNLVDGGQLLRTKTTFPLSSFTRIVVEASSSCLLTIQLAGSHRQ